MQTNRYADDVRDVGIVVKFPMDILNVFKWSFHYRDLRPGE